MKRVLAVDDSLSIRQMVSLTLRNAGFEVTEAVDGQDGLAKARGSSFDLVVTDLNMPRLNGIEMIMALRKLRDYAFTPVLMLTTESQAEKKEAGRRAGATGWIVKPFSAEKMIAVTKKLVG